MSSPDPLVAEPEDSTAEPLDSWEGAGAVSSVADVWSSDDPLGIVAHTVGTGLDLLDTVMNPLDDLAVAAIGWLIEHISWLHEPLDALAGDPTQIRAQAQTWHNVGAELGSVAAAYRSSTAGGVEGWEGAGSEAYRTAVSGFADRLDDTAGRADGIALVLLATGEGVGRVRGDIRDAIADFVWQAVQLIAGAALAAFVTFGGALAAGALHIVFRALDLAWDNIRRVDELIDTLAAAGTTAGRLADGMRTAALHARFGAPVLRDAAGDIVTAAENAHVDDVVEVGKQISSINEDRQEREA